MVYYIMKICYTYCKIIDNNLQNNCRIYCQNPTHYAMNTFNNSYPESAISSPTLSDSPNFEPIRTHFPIVINHNISPHINDNTLPLFLTNHSSVRTSPMPRIASFDRNDNQYDYVRTPPPRYEDLMKVNQLPNYKDAVQQQKYVKY